MRAKPVFSLNRRCSAAMRRIAAFVDQRIAAEKALIASDFQRLREVRGLERIAQLSTQPALEPAMVIEVERVDLGMRNGGFGGGHGRHWAMGQQARSALHGGKRQRRSV